MSGNTCVTYVPPTLSSLRDNENGSDRNHEHLYRTYDPSIYSYHDCRKVYTGAMTANAALEERVTMEELLNAVRKGKAHKSPGQEGISHEFYRMTWTIIKHNMLDVMNHVYKYGSVTDAQKSGTLVCLPKKADPGGPDDYRPFTLLNADHILLTRTIANRLKPWMSDILQPSQHCGRQGNAIFEVVASMRDIIAYTEVCNESVCLLTIDFKEAFDRISHYNLNAILREYGYSE